MAQQSKVKNVIVVSDLHAGCRFGLLPKHGFKLDGGITVKPSKLQLVMYNWWEEFWGDWVPTVVKGEPYNVVVNGDLIDGVHHQADTPVTQNLKDQKKIAIDLLRPIADKCNADGGRVFVVRGTEAHAGKSAQFEEEIAAAIDAVPDVDGHCARWELWLRVKNQLVHFLHTIGTTGSSAHEASAVNAELIAEFVEAARWQEEPPAVIVRSHRHRNIEVRLPTAKGFATATVTPAWQLKTPFVYRIAGMRLAPPQIGGVLIRHGDRQLFTEPKVWHIKRPEADE